MRIYSNCLELMSEMARELNSYGLIVRPKTYQNKVIEGNDDFTTKELICKQYCLTSLNKFAYLFIFSDALNWANAEFKERVAHEFTNPGQAWKLREDLWEQFLVQNESGDLVFDYTYNQRLHPALENVIELLKHDPGTRKAVLPIFNGIGHDDTQYYDGSKRIPCSMYYDFLIRWNGKGEKVLNICYHQRSSDFCIHFGNDVYLAWRLMEHVAKQVGIGIGYLYHTIDSLHAYKKDWPVLEDNLEKLL